MLYSRPVFTRLPEVAIVFPSISIDASLVGRPMGLQHVACDLEPARELRQLPVGLAFSFPQVLEVDIDLVDERAQLGECHLVGRRPPW